MFGLTSPKQRSRALRLQGMEAKRDAAEQLARTHILELETKLLEAALRIAEFVPVRPWAMCVMFVIVFKAENQIIKEALAGASQKFLVDVFCGGAEPAWRCNSARARLRPGQLEVGTSRFYVSPSAHRSSTRL